MNTNIDLNTCLDQGMVAIALLRYMSVCRISHSWTPTDKVFKFILRHPVCFQAFLDTMTLISQSSMYMGHSAFSLCPGTLFKLT